MEKPDNMKNKSISYHWIHGLIYSLIFTLIFVTTLICILHFVLDRNGSSVKPHLIPLYLFVVPVITFFIGLRPILGLRTYINTLYKDENDILYIDDIKLDLKNIESFEINETFGSYFIYYKITLKEVPAEFKQTRRNRNYLLCSEKYNIRNIRGEKTRLLTDLISYGLNENLIKYTGIYLKKLYRYSDKFKEELKN